MNSVNILAFDTALTSCSVAVIRDEILLSEQYDNRARGQAERLVPMCQNVLEAAHLSFENLDILAATRGPGTFTGVRIGLAAARGMALALGCPLIGVTTFDVTARNFLATREHNFCGRIAICHDARRSEIYLQLFDLAEGRAKAVSVPMAIPCIKVEQYLDDKVTAVIGTGGEIISPLLSQSLRARLDFPDMTLGANAAMAGRIAWERYTGGEYTADEVRPLYLRPPDAVAPKTIPHPFQNL